MSVQSGMISEPPVNVNDSDHSEVTRLSIFLYSLRTEARVARFREENENNGEGKGRGTHRPGARLRGARSPTLGLHSGKNSTLKGEQGCAPCAAHSARPNGSFLRLVSHPTHHSPCRRMPRWPPVPRRRHRRG